MTREQIHSFGDNILLWDSLDEAIIGVAERTNFGPIILSDETGVIPLILDEEYYSLEDDEEEEDLDTYGRGNFGPIAVYDIHKIIDILMVDMEVDESELEDGESVESKKHEMALEYYEYNIGCAYVGENTPMHLYIATK
jgi:hypothetical protein